MKKFLFILLFGNILLLNSKRIYAEERMYLNPDNSYVVASNTPIKFNSKNHYQLRGTYYGCVQLSNNNYCYFLTDDNSEWFVPVKKVKCFGNFSFGEDVYMGVNSFGTQDKNGDTIFSISMFETLE